MVLGIGVTLGYGTSRVGEGGHFQCLCSTTGEHSLWWGQAVVGKGLLRPGCRLEEGKTFLDQ